MWREKISLLGVYDTGALYYSVMATECLSNPDYTEVTLSQRFNTYGIFVDRGTGRNTPRGNPGDIGRDNTRRRRKWFSTKYYASVHNIQEFYAENLGRQFCNTVAGALDRTSLNRQIIL